MNYLDLDIAHAIARISLAHPVGNRINFAMREELYDAIGQVAESEARVLVIQGNGDDFCLGGDAREWPGISSAELRPKIEVFAHALARIEQLPIPVIASVQGNCAGGGFELALSCDLLIATRSARFTFPEARLGIMTLQGGILQLAERIGRTKALEMVLLTESVTAEQLAAWNIVNRVVDDGELITVVDDWARRLANGLPEASAATKRLVRRWEIDGLAAAMESLYDVSMPLFDLPGVQTALRTVADAMHAGRPIPNVEFGTQRNVSPLIATRPPEGKGK